ncbi:MULTISPECIES: YlbL family protein [Streptomycetaceae]|uniref:endopeptidase La n=1 Tax=Streptantibioticus cattleyicolor (strain ATCC 35852 / DSM 46488 / JCM 4925 / NBRC 14057 / NRRL 8057) TaxID=1003195 RepID=F8K4R4_STREN|nr:MULTISPECIES: PDZ domain-containing protein [Streptomycetaceae]AEW96424.1 secreted protein [Streptantibioticus cattleyicolor NRRL 8057 = DSM 46488]MYS60932.1 PDZ domain-containing protein [Streptomyces sp. SID5468]CCB76760.1 putative secreted protein [Streptantibioticus cattleyicolor NRRL 8057 = DSM 46488]
MPRRTATLLTSTLLLIALLCAGVLMSVPYAEMSPGPTVNTLAEHDGEPVVQISGHRTYPVSGHLNMTTVRVTGADYPMNLIEAISGWLSNDDQVVPRETIYPKGQSAQQVDRQNAEEFTQSQDSAKVAALRALHIPVASRVVVGTVLKGGAAEGTLHAGDVIDAVDGTPVKEPADVAKLVTKHHPGQTVEFTVTPAKGGGQRRLTVGTKAQDGRAVVGIQAAAAHSFPFTIDIKLADVGGPSAGLMFSLGIIDKLTPTDLTGGTFVAGTGTIDDDGKVGPIGGIALKAIAARDAGARFFLTPKDNCAAAAKDTPAGLRLVKVGTLDDALAALKDIREGKTGALPACPVH